MKRFALLMVGVMVLVVSSQAIAADKMQDHRLMSIESRDVVNKEVRTEDGERIGQVQEVVSDSSGRPAYLMISENRYPDRLTAIPVAYVDRVEGNHLVLDINRNWVERAPHFAKYEWPSRDQRKWDEVRGYYGGTTLLPPMVAPDRPMSRAGGVGPGGSDNPGVPGTGSAGGTQRGRMR
jgi:hypothetical protein